MTTLGANPDNFAIAVGRVIRTDVAGATAAMGDLGGCGSGAYHCVCRFGKMSEKAALGISEEVRGCLLPVYIRTDVQ